MDVRRVQAAWTLVAFSVACVSTETSDTEVTGQRFLKLDRATANTLMVEVPCRHYCDTPISLKIKTSPSSPWRSPQTVTVHSSFNDTFILEDLQPDTLYYIRAYFIAANEYTRVLTSRTCAAQPPPVTSLRVVDGGAGWLDVRWTPPRETCDSRFWYAVRYKAGDKAFTPYRKYGMFTHNFRYARFRPSHPCPTWPGEFCLLLTDSVEAGKNHTIEVEVVRVANLPTEERSAVVTTHGLANTSNLGPFDASPCSPADNTMVQCPTGNQRSMLTDEDPERRGLPLWVTVTGWATASFLLVVIIVMSVVVRSSKTGGVDFNNDTATSVDKQLTSLEMQSQHSTTKLYLQRNKE